VTCSDVSLDTDCHEVVWDSSHSLQADGRIVPQSRP